MNRNDLRSLARVRLKEARVLLKGKLFDGAYYLAGYAIECALKACVASKTKRHDYPDKQTVADSYTHDLKTLLRVAGLNAELEQATVADKALQAHWQVVLGWKEVSRYQRTSGAMATALVRAVADTQHGVLRWLRQHW
jgi:HEPN domain-containing protein